MIVSSMIGQYLIRNIMTEYLFAFPIDGHDKLPLCDVSQTRKAVFDILISIIREMLILFEHSPLISILEYLTPLHKWVSTHIKFSWSI